MKCLVVIPCLHHKFTFSAPLAWLFSKNSQDVSGVYSQDLTPKLVKEFPLFIVECNWFTELYEFSLIVNFIKKHNPKSNIVFGGLYSQLKHEEIFKRFDVDFFIKGFNEKPIQMLLNGDDVFSIPNLVGRTFENETTYYLKENELKEIEYNLDWFPDYFKYWDRYPAPGVDIDPDFSSMPLFPSYNYPKKMKDPTKEFRIPSKGGRYHLPMIITSRGGCSSIHTGCDYCMGAKVALNLEIYKRKPIVYDNETLIKHLTQISNSFPYVTLYINSPFQYDFTGFSFDVDATIEIDTNITPLDLEKIIYAFKNCKVHLALYEKGHHGKTIMENYKDFISLEDLNHKIYFFSFKEDAETANIPYQKRLYSEFVFPKWTLWDYYNDFDRAFAYSKRFYFITRQYHLYPKPLAVLFFIRNHIILFVLFILNKLGLFHPEKEMS